MSGSVINISGILNICTSGGNTTFGNSTTGATNILGQVNIANDGLATGGGVNIATNGFGTGSYVTMGSANFPQIYMRSKITYINDVGGIAIIGTRSAGSTELQSNAIYIGKDTIGDGVINIGGSANNTLGAGGITLGSVNTDAIFARSRNIYINNEGTGNTNIGNTYGVLNLTSIYGLITSAAGNSANPASFLTISCKNGQRADALTIQSKYDYNWLIVFYNENGVVRGKVAGVGSGGVDYQTNSDRRLKKNIQPMDSMLENIMRMKPSTFGWITNDDIGYGFIAQEVYEIFPHLRHKHPSCKESCDVNPCDCSGNPVYYGLDYGKFTPYIVKALQEMKISYDAKLQEQSDQITQLLARVAALESS
jgi:hypothetical protein